MFHQTRETPGTATNHPPWELVGGNFQIFYFKKEKSRNQKQHQAARRNNPNT